jgi:cold shock CspA family protein
MTGTGTVKNVLLERMFGFIKNDKGGEDIFFFYRTLDGLDFTEQLRERRVEFVATQDDQGRYRAQIVRPLNVAAGSASNA